MNLFMQFPLRLGKPIFYLMSMKNSIFITSMPRAPDLELENGITITGNNLATARVGACRSQLAVTSMGQQICLTVVSDTNQIQDSQRFKTILN